MKSHGLQRLTNYFATVKCRTNKVLSDFWSIILPPVLVLSRSGSTVFVSLVYFGLALTILLSLLSWTLCTLDWVGFPRVTSKSKVTWWTRGLRLKLLVNCNATGLILTFYYYLLFPISLPSFLVICLIKV